MILFTSDATMRDFTDIDNYFRYVPVPIQYYIYMCMYLLVSDSFKSIFSIIMSIIKVINDVTIARHH